MNSSEVLPQGIPSIDAYEHLLTTGFFTEMESFSNAFVATYAKAMKGYSNRWTADSLHLWSRQWEYPFTFSHVKKFVDERQGKKVKILDAGSGCTFFPYYITQRYSNCYLYCCDNDPSLISNFSKINKTRERVEFSVSDLASLEFEDDFFGIVYGVSVLEHTKDHNKILSEFKRVLKTEGLLILTFDVSFDNRSQFSIEEASNLLKMLDKEFNSTAGSAGHRFLLDVKRKDILTTSNIRDFGDKRLLPWRLTWASVRNQLVNFQIPKKPFFDLTVFCSAWRNC
jgi:SAM-dependent methyltransferase